MAGLFFLKEFPRGEPRASLDENALKIKSAGNAMQTLKNNYWVDKERGAYRPSPGMK